MAPLLRFIGKDLQDIAFSDWLMEQPEELQPIAQKWFDLLKTCGQEVEPIFHDNYPIVCVDHAPFAYVNAYSAHVNVGFFYGAELPDPHGLLQGTGKHMRHIKFRSTSDHNEKAILALIELAYADILQRLMEE